MLFFKQYYSTNSTASYIPLEESTERILSSKRKVELR